MTTHTDHKGDVFTVTNNDGRVTVSRGPSVVMSAIVDGKSLRVVSAHQTAPSKLFVLHALGLAEPPKPEPAPVVAPAPKPDPTPPPRRRKGLNG